jgi:hypothetical protein
VQVALPPAWELHPHIPHYTPVGTAISLLQIDLLEALKQSLRYVSTQNLDQSQLNQTWIESKLNRYKPYQGF